MLSDKTEQLVIKVSKQMHQQLCEKAIATGTGLSELIRRAISASIDVAPHQELIRGKAAQLQDDAKQAGVPVRDHCRMLLDKMASNTIYSAK